MLCWLFYVCDRDAMIGFAFFILLFVVVVGIMVVGGLAMYFEAKVRAPPISAADIQRIIDDVARRARERGDLDN